VKNIALAPLGLALILGVTGCASSYEAAWPSQSPSGADLPAYRPSRSPDKDSGPPAQPEVLTLRQALELALLHNPDLRVFAWEVRAREAHALQAGLLPNPEIGTEVENFAGTGPLEGLDASEITIGLSQLIELGGDRRRRRDVAVRETDLAGWDYESVRLDIFTGTAQTFASVLAAQERLSLADSLRNRARQFYQSVASRVEAGKVSALAERRALVVRSSAEIQFQRAVGGLAAARSRLAALWGSPEALFHEVAGALEEVTQVPSLEVLSGFLIRNPDVARWETEMELRRADAALARARRVPDPVISVGTRRLKDVGESALTAGVSIPLPLFNRNQGAIREAEYRIISTEAASEAAEIRVGQMLSESYQGLLVAYAEVTTLRTDVVPAAQENFSAIDEGYREGKFDLLTVLDAQRTLFETTNQYVDALEAYHQTLAEVERLIGTPITGLSNQ
jgi:outer membrane protein, heavy metal efflux system